jgi:flavin reductase (DIM6/NTAB) family NADH-FMN oxidoreductase RutF
MEVDPTTLSPEACYKLVTGAVVPRPIALVSSGIDPHQVNLAPFSTFTFVSSYPPLLGFSCGPRGRTRKDTSLNINAHGEYVVHIADANLLEAVHLSSKDHPPHISEVEMLDLKTLPSTLIRTPRLADAPIGMECRLHQVLKFGHLDHEFFVGEVVRFHIRDGLYVDGKIDTNTLGPLSRIAGPNYALLGDILTFPAV